MQSHAVSGAATAIPRSSDAAIGLAENFDSFLKLLTTQLTNQDPLQPMDANEFTAQLVQFSGVEQSIKTNRVLEELVGLARADQFARAAAYVGRQVTVDTAALRLDAGGAAEAFYRLADPAASVTFRIRDESGRVVFEGAGDGRAGSHTVPWNGLDQQGQRLPAGLYRVEVQATDGAGQPLDVETSISGTVDGVEINGAGRLMLSVDGVLVPSDALLALRAAATIAT